MAQYDITSPDGQKFRITAPDNASEQDVMSYAQQNMGSQKPTASAQPPDGMDDLVRPAKALASNAIGALPDMFTAMPRMAGQAIAAGGRAIGMNPNLVDSANPFDWATKVPQLSQIARMGMDQVFPTAPAQTQGQRFSEGAANFAGSVAGGGLGAKMILGIVPQAAEMMIPRTLGDYAGTVGGTLGAGAGNAVFPDNPIMQAIMTMAGGVGAGGTAAAMGAGKNALVETTKPFTQGGREQIVGQAYNQAAQNPQTAMARMSTAPQFVPGSVPMTGSASEDYGLLSLQKALRNQNGPQFADAESSQNSARNIMLDSMAKNEGVLQGAKDARNLTTEPMREEAFHRADLGQQKADLRGEVDDLVKQYDLHKKLQSAGSPLAPSLEETSALEQKIVGKAIDHLAIKEPDAQPLNKGFFLDTLRDSLSTPQASRQSVEQAVNWVSKRVGNKTDPRSLYEVRKDINDAMQGKYSGDLADLKLAKGELKGIKTSLDDAIESSAPGYKAYLDEYATQSKPINQMETLQDVKSRVMLSAPDAKTGYDFISQPKWSNVVQGNKEELSKILTPDQMARLDLITKDMDRGALANNPAIRPMGSDTQRNQTMAQMLGSLATGRGLSKIPLAGKAFDWLQSMAQKDIDNLMVEAMLDPKLAAQLMKKASVPNIPSFSQALQRKAMQLGIPISLELQKKRQ